MVVHLNVVGNSAWPKGIGYKLILQRKIALLRNFGYDYETWRLRRFERRWPSRERVRLR